MTKHTYAYPRPLYIQLLALKAKAWTGSTYLPLSAVKATLATEANLWTTPLGETQ